ncbi:general transcription factor II-I repeat domain-containing protein 2A [Trichonephila clavipes]|nr:general transcription factor II-I repeat domain-containing protein 2A [Trichonephila clavipes]
MVIDGTRHNILGTPPIKTVCILAQNNKVNYGVLRTNAWFTCLDNVMVLVTKIVKHLSSQSLNKRNFDALLDEVFLVYNGLLMNNNVRWLICESVLQRSVDCLDEIRLFLQNKRKTYQSIPKVVGCYVAFKIDAFYRHMLGFQ